MFSTIDQELAERTKPGSRFIVRWASVTGHIRGKTDPIQYDIANAWRQKGAHINPFIRFWVEPALPELDHDTVFMWPCEPEA